MASRTTIATAHAQNLTGKRRRKAWLSPRLSSCRKSPAVLSARLRKTWLSPRSGSWGCVIAGEPADVVARDQVDADWQLGWQGAVALQVAIREFRHGACNDFRILHGCGRELALGHGA